MTKTDLKDFRARERELRGIEKQLERLRARAEGLSAANITDMPKAASPSLDPMGDATADMADLYADYEHKWDELIEVQRRIEDAIASLSDPTHRALVRLRYIEGLRWEKVCVELCYGWDAVHRMHRRILQILLKP